MKTNIPLVSVVIATYNSSNTIEETLESIKKQDYPNIELIITDDASKDNTINVCRKWISENKANFSKTIIVESKVNTGIGANFNRGINASKGEWIKILGADDILFPICISKYIRVAAENPEYKVFVAKVTMFKDEFKEENIILTDYQDKVSVNFSLPVEQQLRLVAKRNYIFAPSVFVSRKVFNEIGGYDSESLIEDYPFHIKVMEHGYRYLYINEPLIGYRKSSNSLTGSDNRLFNYRFVSCRYRCYRDYGFKYLTRSERNRERFRCLKYMLLQNAGMNRNNSLCKFVYKVIDKVEDLVWSKV